MNRFWHENIRRPVLSIRRPVLVLVLFFIIIFGALLFWLIQRQPIANAYMSVGINARHKVEMIQSFKKRLLGTKLTSLETVLGDSLYGRGKPSVVFVFSGFDCGTCIGKGMTLAMKIDSICGHQQVYVVGSDANFGNLQEETGYKHYIFNDEHEAIRKQLRYFYTPVVLLLDSSEVIKDAYYPLPSGDQRRQDKFMSDVLSTIPLSSFSKPARPR